MDGDAIVIIDENNNRQIWDYMTDHEMAEEVAQEIEVSLRSISYIKSRILELFDEVAARAASLDYCALFSRASWCSVAYFHGVTD
ncbi:MAG: hypothetical protein JSV27_01055 [Candidatus Bathyarchaeota archaeon]|nr:MAG: hypothetical protein JSV27_01055 [Candidatus Bathyarchaeota archaeon]